MKNLPQITPKGSVRNEPKVVNYVQHMLASVGLNNQSFTLTICKKIPSGGSHHEGVEVRMNGPTGVRLYVQYGDNGTRFECYLSSKEIKPKGIYTLLSSKLTDCHYVMERPTVQKVATSKTPPISGAFVAPSFTPPETSLSATAEKPASSTSNRALSLKGLSQDTEAIQLIILGLNTAYGASEFNQHQFYEIVQRDINADAKQAHSGQLIRRMTELGYLIKLSEGNPRIKLYKLASDHVATPKIETAPVTPTEQSMTLIQKVEELQKKMSEISRLESKLRETEFHIKTAEEEVANIENRLQGSKARLANLKAMASEYQSDLMRPEYLFAKQNYEALSRLLSAK